MRVHLSLFLSLPLSIAIAFPTASQAQGWETRTSTGVDFDALKAQLREELKEELKAEIKAELAEEGASTGGVQQDNWAEEEWKWEEPVKPELNFLEFDGYFRFRYDLFKNLDLGTYYRDAMNRDLEFGPFSTLSVPPVPACNTDVSEGGCRQSLGDTDTLGGANMRLRLEPVFNVYEDIKIKMQWDIFDNLVLGSTPDGFPPNPISPLLAFSQTQISPSDGRNALFDSIRVKRVWAEVGTPLGQIRVGRMPSHFGMGLLANEGRGIDSDFGDSNDRLMFATKFGDYYIVPAFDWAVSGPTSANTLFPYGQPFDRDQRDDVDQYILAVVKRDNEQQIKEKLENDEMVLNYGTYQVLRFQALDSSGYIASKDPNAGTDDNLKFVKRDAQAWIYSVWAKLLWRKLSLEAEYVGIYGNIGNPSMAESFSAPKEPDIKINQHAAAFNGEYKLLRDALTLSFLFVFATGDPAPGWGVFPFSDPAPRAGSWDGSQGTNGKINNFRVDPDFHVDMIFWRQLVGMVTDAMVFRPGVQYNLTEGLGGRLDIVYSRAMFKESTPSASRSNGGDNNLGVEFDAKVFYMSEDGFNAWLQYGLLVPLGGLDSTVMRTDLQDPNLNAGVAHTIQAMLAITF
jgi:uncharacterized protein (TIGR04551 family)